MRRYRKAQLITASEIARYVYCQRAWGYDREQWHPHRRQRLLLALGGISLLLGVALGAFATLSGV